jgi:acetyl-CoA carboxylase biotin carboxylase subunit
MEVNARLQVEHPVTEMVTGIDLVEKQLRIAAGEPLGLVQEGIRFEGSAVEFRINAEDPDDGFRPDPGTVTAWEPPRPGDGELLRFATGPGGGAGIRLRLDSHVEAGYTVPPYYDSLLGKLIVHGPDRAAVLEAAARAVGGFRVGGVKTTLPLHARILASDPFRTGVYDLTTLPAMLVRTGSGGR